MSFSDNKHNPAGIVFYGAAEVDPLDVCKPEVLGALDAWRRRLNPESRGLDFLRVDGCPCFSISYDGKANNYWPDESANDISETLVREFLYHDGICTLTDGRDHLFHARYRLVSPTDADCLLICPYLTAAGNISGVVVVTVTRKIRESRLPTSRAARSAQSKGPQ